MEQWYVTTPGGETDGPHTTADIVSKIRAGKIDEESKVCPAGGSVWVPMRDVREFDRALRRAPTMMNLQAPKAPPPASPPGGLPSPRAKAAVPPLGSPPGGSPASPPLPAIPPLAAPPPAEDTIRPPGEKGPEPSAADSPPDEPPSPLAFGPPASPEPAQPDAELLAAPAQPDASPAPGATRPSRVPEQLRALPVYRIVAGLGGLLLLVGAIYTLADGGNRGVALMLVGLGALILAGQLQRDPTLGGGSRS